MPEALPIQPHPEILLPFDKEAVADVERRVDILLDSIKNHELRLATNYARLGGLLLYIRTERYWLHWGHSSFGSYIETLRERIDRGRSQLYQILSVAEKLLPFISESDLGEMGISKASELKRFVTQTGRRIPESLLAIALDPTKKIDELKAAVFEEMHQKPESAGKYRDLGGFYADTDEWAEITRGFELAKRVDPIIPNDIPEWAQRKEIMLRFAREFVGTYQDSVARGEA